MVEARRELPGERHIVTFKPKGKVPTEYEEVSCDCQPDARRYSLQGYFYKFQHLGGRLMFDENSTRLKSTYWEEFRDPAEEWERPFVARSVERERMVVQQVERAKVDRLFAYFDPVWVEVLGRHFAASAFPEHALFRSLVIASREALCATLTNVLYCNAGDKLRYSQSIPLYSMDLEEQIPGFSDAEAKGAWMEDPLWQGARENVERILVTIDWGEQIIATNLVYEPTFGVLSRREFFTLFAPANGDMVTPALIAAAQLDWHRNLGWTREWVRVLCEDREFGPHNRRVIQEWLSKWLPYSIKAAQSLASLFEIPRVKPQAFAKAYGKAVEEYKGLLEEMGLKFP